MRGKLDAKHLKRVEKSLSESKNASRKIQIVMSDNDGTMEQRLDTIL